MSLHSVLAAVPILVLLALTVKRMITNVAAAIAALGSTLVLAAIAFEAPGRTILFGSLKGIWLGVWIMCVIGPALLLYRLAEELGITEFGTRLLDALPGRSHALLLAAWVLPAFVQGVAGFGTPIAVAAPLLLAMGWGIRASVAYPLIGYHWAVTFGSMGSSYFMAALTAGLDDGDQTEFALLAALLLSVHCCLAGLAIVAIDGGWTAAREMLGTVLVTGVAMSVALAGAVQVSPSIGSLAAGFAGLVVLMVRRRATETSRGRARNGLGGWVPVVPYVSLVALVLPVFLTPAIRAFVRQRAVVAPHFPATSTGRGFETPSVAQYSPLQLLGHPGFFLLVASAVAVALLVRRSEDVGSQLCGVGRRWARALPRTAVATLALCGVATVMVESAMILTLSSGIATVFGRYYGFVAPVMGALGSFLTGSTTTSNALLAPLQTEIATHLGVRETIFLAGQTVGGNVGNSFAPVVILVGVSALGRDDAIPEIASLATRVAMLFLALDGLVIGVAALLTVR